MAPWVARVLGYNGQRRWTLGNEPLKAAYCFPYNTLHKATKKFDAKQVVGHGGFGKVYMGELPDGTKIAAKRGSPMYHQGLNEFLTEIEALSELRHRHLVPLIGYCDKRNEMILVYEYMEKGTLRSHLYGSNKPSLSWERRLQVCIGAARGLHYLHTGSKKDIIHRDVKSSNILLDQKFVAKVADFGLSKICTELDLSHVSTDVKFSFGYCDPEYASSRRLTKKSDVYSFGVVLLEVLCARPALDQTLSSEEMSLANWGLQRLRAGQWQQIVDPRISGKIGPDARRKYIEIVEKCLANNSVDRPSMEDILKDLNDVLQLQKAHSLVPDGNTMKGIVELPSQPQNTSGTIMAEAGPSNKPDHDLSDMPMSQVFSHLMAEAGPSNKPDHDLSDTPMSQVFSNQMSEAGPSNNPHLGFFDVPMTQLKDVAGRLPTVSETKQVHVANGIESHVASSSGMNGIHQPLNELLGASVAHSPNSGGSSYFSGISGQHKLLGSASENSDCSTHSLRIASPHKSELPNRRTRSSSDEMLMTESSRMDDNVSIDARSLQNGEDGYKPRGTIIPNSQVQDEWIEQYEPGVYITLKTLRDGTRDIKRVRFSRRRFDEHQAENWWGENREKIYERYNIRSSVFLDVFLNGV